MAWIADETHVLDLYRNGVDLYKHVASVIYGIPVDQVTKAQRQIGKVAMLALGYQGWVTAFQAMAVGYGVKISDYEAMKVARQWRKDRPKTVRLWEDCEKAAASALAERGKVFSAGMCHFAADKDWLFIRLPSSRTLFYREPHFRKVTRTYGERVVEKVVLHYWGTDSQSGRWMVQGLHGGKIVENIVQAIGRDLQADAMLDMVDYDWRIVMHTHDEVTAESRHPDSLEDFCYLMKQTPDWAPGLPIEAEGWTGPRYRK